MGQKWWWWRTNDGWTQRCDDNDPIEWNEREKRNQVQLVWSLRINWLTGCVVHANNTAHEDGIYSNPAKSAKECLNARPNEWVKRETNKERAKSKKQCTKKPLNVEYNNNSYTAYNTFHKCLASIKVKRQSSKRGKTER